MLASDAPSLSLNLPSERFDRQKALKEERANDMRSFLDKQARENPRLRRLRASNAPIQTSITHPYSGQDVAESEYILNRNENTRQDPKILESERLSDNFRPSPPKNNHPRLEYYEQNYNDSEGRSGIPREVDYAYQNPGGSWPRYNHPPPVWYPPQMPYNSYYPAFDNYSPYVDRNLMRDNYGRGLQPMPPNATREQEPPFNRSLQPTHMNNNIPVRHVNYRHEFEESESVPPAVSKSKAQSYAAELQKQIEEKKARERAEKQMAMSSPFTRAEVMNDSTKNSFAENMRNRNDRGELGSGPNRSGGDPAAYSKKQSYLNDLNEQIRLKKEREENEKMKRRMEDQRKESEMANYSPWGKGGGGAPHANSTDGNSSGRGGMRKNMELQGSNIFSNSNRDNFPPAFDQQHPGANQFQTLPSLGVNNDNTSSNSVNFNPNPYNHGGGGYHTEDIFGRTSDPFIETLRSLALNPSQVSTLLNQVPASTASTIQNIQRPTEVSNEQVDSKNFLRGVKTIESLPDWQRSEVLKKQLEQSSIQEALKYQIAQKNAEKALQAKAKKEEDEKEQLRLEKEREYLKAKYAKEVEEQRKREEEARIENERKAKEKAEQLKLDQDAEDKNNLAVERSRLKKSSILKQEAQESHHSVNQPVVPRVASPPVPALAKRMGSALPVQSQDTNQTQTISDKNTEKNGNVTNIHYPSPKSNTATSSDTQAILQQLAEIQRELENEERNIKIELSTPMTFESNGGLKLSEIKQKSIATVPIIPTDRKNRADFFDIIKEIEPHKSSAYHLKRQNALLSEQEKELSALKESLLDKRKHSDINSPGPRHFRSTPKWNHEDDYLVKYLSKEPVHRREEYDQHGIDELRLNVEEEASNKIKDDYFENIHANFNSFESRPRSRRREAKQRNRSSEEEFQSTLVKNETRSDSSFDIALIEELNEKRLRRLAELNANQKIKSMPETDIIDSFLKRESLKNMIPSNGSTFQPIY